MRDAIRHFAAEFIGVFALVFIAGGALMTSGRMAGGSGLIVAAFAHGLVYAAMVTATMRISGHLNPAVTLGFMATRRIEPMMGAVYIVAQFLGAILAAYALSGLFPDSVAEGMRLGGQRVALDVGTTQAILLEAIATFLLVFVVFATAVDAHAPRVGGLAIGLIVVATTLVLGPLTGASLNPARSFGPAVAAQIFEGQVVYWVGPIVGGLTAAVLYDALFLRRGVEPADHGAVSPR